MPNQLFTPKLTTLGVFLIWIAGSAQASEGTPLYPQAFVGAKVGYLSASDSYYSDIDPQSSLVGLYGGLQLSKAWSWDLGYQHHQEVKADLTGITVQNSLIESALRYDWYLRDDISIYGRLGAAYWMLDKTAPKLPDIEAQGFSPIGEIGVNYHLTKNTRLSVGYQYINQVGDQTSGEYDSHALLLGLSYTFGRHSKTEPLTLRPVVNEVNVAPIEPPIVEETFVTIDPDPEPEPAPAPQQLVKPILIPVVTMQMDFGTDVEAQLKKALAQHEEELATIVAALEADPKAKVVIEGHTDSIGSYQTNQKLSEERAQAIADELVYQGISLQRMIIQGKGETNPIANNLYAPGRAENRRVDINILSYDAQYNGELTHDE